MNLVRWVGLTGLFGWLVCGCGGGGHTGGLVVQNGPVDDGGGASSPDPVGPGVVTRDWDASASHPGIAYSVTLTMTEFTVPAGTEAWKCQDFGDPFGGQPVDIKGWDSTMTAGSHHLTLYNQPGATDGPLSDCPDGVTAPTYAFGAQSEKTTFAFPDTVGEHIPAGLGYTMNSHYVNATAAAIHTNVSVTAFVAAPGVVTQYAGAFEGVLLSIAVPPGRPSVVVGGSCTLPQDLNVIAVSGHMHHRGSNFNLTSGGTSLLQTDEIAAAPSVVSPPLLLKAGADISWSCTYTNPTSNLLTYGNSAWANVMCNTILVFYPIQDTNNGLLDCTL